MKRVGFVAIAVAMLINACAVTGQSAGSQASVVETTKTALVRQADGEIGVNNKIGMVFDVREYKAYSKDDMDRTVLSGNEAFEVSVHSITDSDQDGKFDTVKYNVVTPKWSKIVDFSLNDYQIEVVNQIEDLDAELRKISGFDGTTMSQINDKLAHQKKSNYAVQRIDYYDPNMCIAFDWWCVFWNAGTGAAAVAGCFVIGNFLGVLACGSMLIGSGMYNVITNCGTYVPC